MRAVGRGLLRFLRIYAAYFLLVTAILVVGYGLEVGGVGTIAVSFLIAFGSLGIAFAHLIPNFDAAAAYVNAVFLPVIFISGVFYSTKSLPEVFKVIAEALPLKHVIDGLHGAIVTGQGLGDNLTALAVVAGWAAVGLFLTVRYFRWD